MGFRASESSVAIPPAPDSDTGLRCHGLRKAGIEPHRLAIRDALREWMSDRRVSVRDLKAMMNERSMNRVQGVLSGVFPLPYEWLSQLPPRDRRELQSRIDYAVETLSRLTA